MLLTTLRRAAQEHTDVVSALEHGREHGLIERAAGGIAEVNARIVEGTSDRLRAVPVTRATVSGLHAFLDGIQRARVKLYAGPVPIVYAYGAAVVRTRAARRMVVHAQGLLDEREAVLFPFRLLDPLTVRAWGVAAEHMVDTSPPAQQPLPLFPPVLIGLAARAVNRWREGIERNLAGRWCAHAGVDEWLLVDGPLTLSPGLSAARRAVGLVRSQRTRFFDGDDARLISRLQVGERSSVFQPHTRRWTPVHSWYLRLRDPTGRDAFWGLVRVEVAAHAGSTQTADRVSGWLLAEVAPLTLPEARWDHLLYPIHDCKQFLRARAPTLRG
ncbi:MAG: hypothetical protein ACRENP_27240 [Longimicrobiales bacterium]